MKKLRKQMIAVVFLSVIIVFALILGMVHFSLYAYYSSTADGMTQIIGMNGGVVPNVQDYLEFSEPVREAVDNFNEESAYRTRYFVVYLDENMTPVSVNMEHIAAVDVDEAVKMAKKALREREETGYVGSYRFRLTQAEGERPFLIFLDCQDKLELQRSTTLILAFTVVLFAVLVTLVFALLSKHALRPFEENSRRQKQFITDASHELKTPLAIIAANADVLEYKDGGSEWLSNITGQVHHMSELINELLVLSKMDEVDSSEILIEPVDITKLIYENVDRFEEVFDKKRVEVVVNAPEVTINCNREQIDRLVSILLDNAAKYVTEEGRVEVTLRNSARYAALSIFNTAELDDGVDCEKLFDRFYRPDSSRSSSTGGHGIGLSIAKKITSQYNGSISARKTEDGICFTASISNRMKLKEEKKKQKG